jgi:hypothetical protein
MNIEVEVADLALDPNSNVPIMILKEKNGTRVVPVWIGIAEASSIARYRAAEKPERPLTHDLMKLLIDGFDGKVNRVVIHDLRENTFFARIFLTGQNNKVLCLDARPSDAVALAIRCLAPIYVEDKILGEKDSVAKEKIPAEGLNAKDLRDKLRNIDPLDFGKYSME